MNLVMKMKLSECNRCELHKGRTKPVIGAGDKSAKVMIIGEAPGATEDQTGVPFAGQAGGVLDSLLPIAGLTRKSVYITNAVKCRPPSNRNPTQTELETCFPFLDKQIDNIKPELIILLGKIALSVFFEYTMSESRGQVLELEGYDYKFVTSYHPAAALYNMKLLPSMETDFSFFGEVIKSEPPDITIVPKYLKAAKTVEKSPGQFSLFKDGIPAYIDWQILQLIGTDVSVNSINDLYQKLRNVDGNIYSVIAERLHSTLHLLKAYSQNKSDGILNVLKYRGLFIKDGSKILSSRIRSNYGIG
jgi:uracil-DNA glycosylase